MEAPLPWLQNIKDMFIGATLMIGMIRSSGEQVALSLPG